MHPTAGLATKNSQKLLTYAENEPPDTGQTITTYVSARWGAIRQNWRFFASLHRLRDAGVRSIAATTFTDVT